MSTTADDSVDRMQRAGRWGDEPNEVVEPDPCSLCMGEKVCPECGGSGIKNLRHEVWLRNQLIDECRKYLPPELIEKANEVQGAF